MTPYPETCAAQGLGQIADPHRDVAPPIYPSTTYERGADGSYPGGRVYSRDQNPNYDTPEALLAGLEGGHAALLMASGNAAAAVVFQSLPLGARILAPRNMYWALRKWLLQHVAPSGMTVAFYDNANIDDLAQKSREQRCDLIWVESPANPTWDVTDIAAAAQLARAAGAYLAVDSTAATPVHSQPIALGADLVMHSATKYLNGHSDVIAGALVTAQDNDFWQRIRYGRAGGGAVLGPFEAWLLLRGMRTLFVRVRVQSANAALLCARLEGHPALSHVIYPGLPSHPGHATALRQMTGGFGGMFSIRVAGGASAAMAMVARLKVWKRATSLGSVESLVEHRASVEGPGSTCPTDLIRFSTGIEHVEDLYNDLLQALSQEAA
jgi:cystathionine gamma-synthase